MSMEFDGNWSMAKIDDSTTHQIGGPTDSDIEKKIPIHPYLVYPLTLLKRSRCIRAIIDRSSRQPGDK